jgi:hypothetical protein
MGEYLWPSQQAYLDWCDENYDQLTLADKSLRHVLIGQPSTREIDRINNCNVARAIVVDRLQKQLDSLQDWSKKAWEHIRRLERRLEARDG